MKQRNHLILVILLTLTLTFSGQQALKLIQAKQEINITPERLMKSGIKAYYQGNLDHALIFYREIISRDNDNLKALKNLAYIYHEKGQFEKALKTYKKILYLLPDNSYWKFRYGILLFENGNYKESSSVLKGLIEQDKTNDTLSSRKRSFIFYYLGIIEIKNKHWENAIGYLSKAIKEAPYLALNYATLGEVYQQLGRLNKANEYFRKALGKDYSYTYLYPELAKNYYQLGDKAAAYYYWQKSRNTGNQVEIAKKWIERIEKKHPEFLKKEEDEQSIRRSKIDWVEVEPVLDNNQIPNIRIGLVESVNKLAFQTGGNFKVIDKDNQKVIVTGKGKDEWKIEYKNNTFFFYKDDKLIDTYKTDKAITIKKNSFRHTITVYNISYGQGYYWAGTEDRQYRGVIELLPVNNKHINVINIVNLEAYLLSVVPAEMPAWWPMEALKAQSIAARSYALNHLQRHTDDGFNLCDSVHCAVYKGVNSENSRSSKAVLATSGEVAMYDGEVIDAVFSSNSGGYSESSFEVWGNNYPYLKGTNNMLNNNNSFPLQPFELAKFILNNPPSFSSVRKFAGYNNYRWVKELPVSYLINKYDLRGLVNILPRKRTKGGSVNQVILIGKNKRIELNKDQIRSGLGGLRSNRFIIDKIYNNKGLIEKIIFYGSGFGHNVGLDQTGAAGMAEKGYNYRDIITHFYKSVEIKKQY